MSPTITSFTTKDGTSIRLSGFKGQYQAQPTWCWAATVAGVHAFVLDNIFSGKGVTASSFPQCYFVDRQKGGETCRLRRFDTKYGFGQKGTERLNCQDLGCSIRDQVESGFPEAALEDPNLDLHFRTEERPVSFSVIRQEIDRGFPVVIRVKTGVTTHHIVTIIGYETAIPALIIWDPAEGENIISVNAVQKRYGRWTHTIFVRLPEDH